MSNGFDGSISIVSSYRISAIRACGGGRGSNNVLGSSELEGVRRPVRFISQPGPRRALKRVPRVQGIVFEDLKHSFDDFRPITKYAKGFLRAPAEDALSSSHAQSINKILGQAERNALRNREQLAL